MKKHETAGLQLDREDPFSGMVKILAGTFRMGKPEGFNDNMYNDAPGHPVTLSHDFWIGRYPVTERFYAEVEGKEWDPEQAEYPHRFNYSCVNDTFLENLNRIFAGRLPEGYQFHIPSEAQWEYAAKAGSDGRLPKEGNGNDVLPSGFCNRVGKAFRNVSLRLCRRTEEQTLKRYKQNVYQKYWKPVWKYPKNPWGLYGMPGGIWEHCRDLFANYPAGAQTDPEGPSGPTGPSSMSGHYHVVRGADCVFRNTERVLHGNFMGARLVISRIGQPRTEEAEKWKEKRNRHESRARSFLEEIYPGRDLEPLLTGIDMEDEFTEYMEFAETVKQENFPFEKTKYCIQQGLDLVSSSCVVFCKDLAEDAAKRWDEEHAGKN